MASKSRIEEALPSNIVRAPDRYGAHLRQTTEPQRETFLSSSSESPSASSVISANLPATNYVIDQEDQPESLPPNTNEMAQLPPQNFEHSTAPWVLASREIHVSKKPMDPELTTRLADIRRQADGTSSTNSSPQTSLALLGSSVSITSSAFSQSFSVLSPPSAVEFPPTPIFTDEVPGPSAEFMRKLELLSVGQTPKTTALKNSHHLLQNSHTIIATRSLDTTHKVDSSTSTSSNPNSTPRQQPMHRPAPTKSALRYTPNPSHYTSPRQTQFPMQTTPSSKISQQPNGLTPTSTTTPRTARPLGPQPSNHPPPMIAPEHNPPLKKANFKAWWNQFTLVKSPKGDPFVVPYRALDTTDHPVFRKPLEESLRCASVRISLRTSTPNTHGDLYVWGFVPIVIAKCGRYLKENATEVPGTFSVSGSNRRMRDLQAAFESPPLYGKSLRWKKESYTTHDIASVFQRYLAHMPEPVIPYDMYHSFRDTLAKEPFNQEQVIATYKSLIRRMPRPNQHLLFYVLDLLMVFASKCDKNLMTATNLAVLFRPSFISHPQHEMSLNCKEHVLSQKVLEFLIAQQDSFMSDILPPTEP